MMESLLISSNPLIQKLFTGVSSFYPLINATFLDNIIDAEKYWLKHKPQLTIIDSDPPEIDPSLFISNLSKGQDLRNFSGYFLFISSMDPEDIGNTKKSLQKVHNGDFILKETMKINYSFKEFGTVIENLYQKFLNTKTTSSLNQEKITSDPNIILEKIDSHPIELVVIGISMGGPFILRKLFSKLEIISLPIVIIQHMPLDFTESLVKSLLELFDLPISIAQQGEVLENKIYFAPEKAHLRIKRMENKLTFLLEHSSPIKGFIPSIEATFESLLVEDIPCLGILMTGLGDDGADNISLLHKRGNPVIAQSREDSLVYGMPSSLIKRGSADGVLNIPMIAEVLNKIKINR